MYDDSTGIPNLKAIHVSGKTKKPTDVMIMVYHLILPVAMHAVRPV